MSIRKAFKAVQVVFGLSVNDILYSNDENAVDARGIYCYITSLLEVDLLSAAKDIRMQPEDYFKETKRYRGKVSADSILSKKAESVRNLLFVNDDVVLSDRIETSPDCIKITVKGAEYKAMDMSTQFGESYMGFINDEYVLTGESLEDAFRQLIHNEIIVCINQMTMEQLRESLKI